MADPSADPLVTGLARGDEGAFAAVYDSFGESLFRTAFALLGSREEAEDAVQDVFVGLIRASGSLQRVTNLRAYLFASLRHGVAARAARHERPVALECVREPVVEPRTTDLERTERLERAVAALPLEQREIVAMKVEGGLTFAEVASVLGVSANTAASRYRYALNKLRAVLEEVPHGR